MLPGNRFHLENVTLSRSSLVVVLRGLSKTVNGVCHIPVLNLPVSDIFVVTINSGSYNE